MNYLFQNLVLATAIGGRHKPEVCFLLVRLGWALLPKERQFTQWLWIIVLILQLWGRHSTT